MQGASSEMAPGWTYADRHTHNFSNNKAGEATTDVTYTLSQTGSPTAKSYTISCQGTYDAGKTRFVIPVPFDYNPDDYYSGGMWKDDNSKIFTVTPPSVLGTPSEVTLDPLCLTFNGSYIAQTYSFELQNMRIAKPSIRID